MKINTYAVNCNDAWLNTEGDDISGSYVKYKDHQEVVAALEARCAALAAENAGLKSAIDATIGWQQSTDPENVESVRMLVDIKTPATDAFLAEVRAQGVESFARTLRGEADITKACTFKPVQQFEDFACRSDEFAAQLRKGVQS